MGQNLTNLSFDFNAQAPTYTTWVFATVDQWDAVLFTENPIVTSDIILQFLQSLRLTPLSFWHAGAESISVGVFSSVLGIILQSLRGPPEAIIDLEYSAF